MIPPALLDPLNLLFLLLSCVVAAILLSELLVSDGAPPAPQKPPPPLTGHPDPDRRREIVHELRATIARINSTDPPDPRHETPKER